MKNNGFYVCVCVCVYVYVCVCVCVCVFGKIWWILRNVFDVFVKILIFHTHLKNLMGRETTQNDFDTYSEFE